jgi:hypothetical protein
MRFATGELNHMGLDPRSLSSELSFLRALNQLVRCHHLGHDKTGAEALRNAPEDNIRHSGQGRENGCNINPNRTYGKTGYAHFFITFHYAQ